MKKIISYLFVDTGIKRTLDKERENFWFLNNGIIIACTEYDIDGDTIKLTDFSIVNGGQTTASLATALIKDKKDNSENTASNCK